MRSTARSESGSLPTRSAWKRVSSFRRTVISLGAVHDMAVGEQIAVGREQKTGTAACGAGGARPGARVRACHLDESHRGRDPLQGADHRARIGIEQRRIVDRHRTCRPASSSAVRSPLRRQHASAQNDLRLRAQSPSTMSRLTRRTKVAGSSSSPPSASIAWSYSTWARSAKAASSAVSLSRSTSGMLRDSTRESAASQKDCSVPPA